MQPVATFCYLITLKATFLTPSEDDLLDKSVLKKCHIFYKKTQTSCLKILYNVFVSYCTAGSALCAALIPAPVSLFSHVSSFGDIFVFTVRHAGSNDKTRVSSVHVNGTQ